MSRPGSAHTKEIAIDPKNLEDEILRREWFYRYKLPSGRTTATYISDDILPIHETRNEMIASVLDPRFAERWPSVDCVDLACHEGYFSLALAQRGCRRVLGLDVRDDHVHAARLIGSAYGMHNLSFDQADLLTMDPAPLGQFDIVLLLGLLYHVENPIGVLRTARALTREVCLVETQVVPDMQGVTDWGSYRFTQKIVGCFGLVDETSEVASGNQEANVSTISLVPSLAALVRTMELCGFSRVEVVPCPAGGYEQLASGKRVVVAGYVS